MSAPGTSPASGADGVDAPLALPQDQRPGEPFGDQQFAHLPRVPAGDGPECLGGLRPHRTADEVTDQIGHLVDGEGRKHDRQRVLLVREAVRRIRPRRRFRAQRMGSQQRGVAQTAQRSQGQHAGVVHEVRIVGHDHRPARNPAKRTADGPSRVVRVQRGRHAAWKAGLKGTERSGPGRLDLHDPGAPPVYAGDRTGNQGRPPHSRLAREDDWPRGGTLQGPADLLQLLSTPDEAPRHRVSLPVRR